jgi:glutamate-ammonia-ligase adenylyltransferase
MEHGLQTHNVPQTELARTLVARRMGFLGPTGLEEFDNALKLHTGNVRHAYDRCFAGADVDVILGSVDESHSMPEADHHGSTDETRLLNIAARIFISHVSQEGESPALQNLESMSHLLSEVAHRAFNRQRALMLTARVAASLDKSEVPIALSEKNIISLVRLCGASEFFGEILAGNPSLVGSLGNGNTKRRKDYRSQLRASIDPEKSFSGELSALRREWSRLLVEIGAYDADGDISRAESNSLQTELAVASINVALLVSRREMVRRYGHLAGGPRMSVLALGRLASGGVDYGSDLDIILIYDSLVSSPVASLTQDEAYARLSELMIVALSSVTREGYLYRVDLRLRPHGNNGPLVTSSEGFLDYLRQQSAIWEWLAFVKLRAVAGDLELGRMVETHARHAIHERAREIGLVELSNETRRVRDLLEREKGKRGRRGPQSDIDIKYSRGGMLDVYFAARYLQLRDDVADEGDDRSTSATLERLEANGSLGLQDFEALSDGYALLRAVDHQLRLIVGKVAALPSTDHPAFREIANRLDFDSVQVLSETLQERMLAIRESFDRLTLGPPA